MPLPDTDLEHLARLARLDLEADERETLRADLDAILAYFEELEAVDTEGVEPLVRPVVPGAAVRGDEPLPSLPREATLALAREAEGGFVKVPRTVDEG